MSKKKVDLIVYSIFTLVVAILIGIWFINSTCAIVTQIALPVVLSSADTRCCSVLSASSPPQD